MEAKPAAESAQADELEGQAMPARFSRSTRTTAQQWRDSDGVMHTVVGDDDLDRDELIRLVLDLRSKMPTAEEMAFLRNEKQQRERYAWAWAVIRQYAGWLVVVGSVAASAIVGLAKGITWVVEHVQWKG